MDDLISRAAAIETLSSFVSPPMAGGLIVKSMIYAQLKALPSVDAVPVDWLRKIMNDADDAGGFGWQRLD